MKFCHTLDAQRKLSPVEWGPFFLNYELLKKKIKAMTAQQLEKADDHHPSTDSGASDTSSHQSTHRTTTPEALSSSQSEVEFFRLMDYEISRGAQFLALSEGEYVLKTRAVLNGFRSTERLLQSPLLGLDKMIPEETAMEMWMRPMQACISVYRELLLLNHWVIVSYCGFSKILKKHDRWTGFITKEKYLRLVVAKQHFTSYPKLHAMLRDMDTLYLSILKRLPQCPQKAAAEATMGEIKRVVAAAGLAFAQDSQELTSLIQDQHRQQKLAAPTPPIGPPKGHWNYSSSSSSSDSGSNSVGGDGDGGGSGRGSENSDASQEERVSRKAAAAGAAPARAAAFLPRITGIRVRGGAKGAPHPASKRLRMMIEQNRTEICRHQSGTFLPSSVVEDSCRDGAAATEPPIPSVTPPHHAGGWSVVIGGDKGGAGVVIGEDGGGDANRLPMGDAAGPGAEAAGNRGAGAKRFAVARGGGLFKVGVTVRMRASPPAEAVAPPPPPPRPPLAARSLGHLAAAAAAAAAADGDVDC